MEQADQKQKTRTLAQLRCGETAAPLVPRRSTLPSARVVVMARRVSSGDQASGDEGERLRWKVSGFVAYGRSWKVRRRAPVAQLPSLAPEAIRRSGDHMACRH